MNHVVTRLGFTAVAIIAGVVPAMAQGTQTASIVGKVVNSDGSPVSGVTVTVSSPALQQQRTVVSGVDGNFRVPLLPPGDYRLVLVKAGFESLVLTQHMGLGQDFSPRVVLASTAQSTVVIVASNLATDKADFTTSTNYTKDAVDLLPINRGNALDLAYLTPGVQQNINSDKGGVTIRGAQGTGNLTLVDGQNVADNLYNGQRIFISFDSVEETQILTGAIPAEYGNVEGGVINQITKIGGNQFSGALRWDWHNPQWNALAPKQSRSGSDNTLLEGRSFSLGGPIVKDHLWFFATYYDQHPLHQYDFSGDEHPPLPPLVSNFTTSENDYRHEVKLTFSPNVNNIFTATYNNSSDAYLRDVSGAGEATALSPFYTKGEFGGLSWSSIISDSLTLYLRGGFKKQTFGSSFSPSILPSVLYNAADNFTAYGAPYFDWNDPQPDDRRNQTYNGKLTWFVEKAGNHQIDLGFDYYKGTTKASGYQTPGRISIPGVGTNLNLWDAVARHYDPNTQTGTWSNAFAELDVLMYVPDQLTVTTTGLYFNDKWTLDQHWLFNIGLRDDMYDAKNQSHGKISSNSSLSPRLGAKYDLFGDTAWVFGAAWNRYQGRPLETIFANAGYSNSPISYSFFAGPGAPATGTVIPGAQFFNPAYYDLTLAPGSFFYQDAASNVRVNPKLKQQTVDETQLSATWNFNSPAIGKGFLRATGVYKKWNNLVANSTGLNGTVNNPIAGTLDIQYWTNDPGAKRSYKDLELDGALNAANGWALSANFTWSDLEGNYIGELKSVPGSGTLTAALLGGSQWASVVGGVQQYDPNVLNPSGRLDGGLTINALASKSFDNAYGKFTLGLKYYHKSGAPFSIIRFVNLENQYPGTAGNTNIKSTALFDQYYDGVGTHTFNSQTDISLAAQQDFMVTKVASRQVVAFMKLAVVNLLNHQQQVNWNITAVNPSGTTTAEAFSFGSSFGQPGGPANYAPPRSIVLSAGIKF